MRSFNFAAHVLAKAHDAPEKTALEIVSETNASRWSYATLLHAVQGIASGLMALGLAPGDRVLMRLGNEVEFPLCYLGAIWAGIIPVPASAALTVPEITLIARQTRPRLIVAGPDISLPDPPDCPVLPALALREMEAEAPAAPHLADPERPAYIVYTSGSSGTPRGVVHAHRAILARQMMWEGWYGLTPQDRLLHAGAFNWTYTLGTGLMDPWTIGATALVPAEGVGAAELPGLISRHDVTIFAAAPAVYRRILRQSARFEAPSLRHGLAAGEKLPDAVRDSWHTATGTAIHEALGMSECSTFISGSPACPAPPGTAGYPQPGRRIAVIDDTGAPARKGTLAIHASDPGLMLGYLDAPGGPASHLRNNWFLTGDQVEQGDDGAIRYLGRADDMLNAGGIRVSPLEIEAVLARHPDVAEVACVERRVKADTTVIAAVYAAHTPVAEASLAALAEARLAPYKRPRLYEWRESLPRAGNGKLDRKALRG